MMARPRTRRVLPSVVVLSAGIALASCSNGTEGTTLTTQAAPERVLAGVRDVRQVSQVTGAASPNKTDAYEVAGQDLGSMFDAGGKTWFVFGDTFGQRSADATGGVGTEWRSNTLAWTTDADPADGIRLDGYVVDNTNWASELIPAKRVDRVEITVIPTYGFAVDDVMYLDYMSVRHWGDPGEWEANYAGLAKSTDQGRTWTKLRAPRWPGDSNFVQVSVTEIDDDLYFWGVPAGRFGGVRLMKVSRTDVEQQDAYRYFAGTSQDGDPRWSRDMRESKTVVDGTVGELSVVWNDYLGSWLMSSTDGDEESARLRQSPTPWGPWDKPVTLLAQNDVPGLYAPYLHPRYTARHGRTIFFSLSKWGPYNVFWYRADLVAR